MSDDSTIINALRILARELEKLRADHDALGNDMNAVCVERDEARAKLKEALEVNAELRSDEAERDNAKSQILHLRKELATETAKVKLLQDSLKYTPKSRPELSRLEIAARIMQGWAGNSTPGVMPGPASAIRIADELIAAAKEAQP